MFYRRKVLLALLQAFDNKLEKVQLQKLLFLLSNGQKEPSYHFVPYKFGCYSFQANADLGTMTKYGQVQETEQGWVKTDPLDYIRGLKKEDQKHLSDIKIYYKAKTGTDLVKLTYKRYPYYAINSTILSQVLNVEEIAKVNSLRPTSNEKVLFTIGYEGLSLESYLNKLIRNDVKVLCDVRKNSFSMKYGFSKSQLLNACEGVGIKFIHIPELGINSDERQTLSTQQDYDTLFEGYKNESLKNTTEFQEKILNLLHKYNRVAITCFEANICQCHRKPLAESIGNLPGFNYEIKHI